MGERLGLMTMRDCDSKRTVDGRPNARELLKKSLKDTEKKVSRKRRSKGVEMGAYRKRREIIIHVDK